MCPQRGQSSHHLSKFHLLKISPYFVGLLKKEGRPNVYAKGLCWFSWTDHLAASYVPTDVDRTAEYERQNTKPDKSNPVLTFTNLLSGQSEQWKWVFRLKQFFTEQAFAVPQMKMSPVLFVPFARTAAEGPALPLRPEMYPFSILYWVKTRDKSRVETTLASSSPHLVTTATANVSLDSPKYLSGTFCGVVTMSVKCGTELHWTGL